MIADYLNDPKLPRIGNEYYLKKFTASDDSLTFNLLDTLTSRNDHFFPFFFSIFNGILIKSDGALSEVMGDYCFRIVSNYPNEIFVFFHYNKEYQKQYTSFLGEEFYFKQLGTSDLAMTYLQFYSYLKKKLNLKQKRMKMTFDEFDIQIKESIKNMY